MKCRQHNFFCFFRLCSTFALLLAPSSLIVKEANAPQIAQAQPARVEISLQSQPNETYDNLLLRAEDAATTAVASNFQQNASLTDVSVVIVAQNQGAIAPLVSLKVSRSQWLSGLPQDKKFTYFNSARSLLRFEEVATNSTPKPAAPTTPQTPNRTAPNKPNTNPMPSGGQIVSPGVLQSPNSPNTFKPVIPNMSPANVPPAPSASPPSGSPNPTPSNPSQNSTTP